MTESEIIIEAAMSARSKPSWHVLVGDFANMLKAFIGANYLSIAYAFKQSGLVPGIIGLLGIALLTDHCCHLIVKCKYCAIEYILAKRNRDNFSSPVHRDGVENDSETDEGGDDEQSEERENEYKRLQRTFTYGDVGKVACGKYGLFIVNACLVFTQFGFCVSYFIFVGNTLHSLFPMSKPNTTTDYFPMTNSSTAENTTVLPPVNLTQISDLPSTLFNSTNEYVSTLNATNDSLADIYNYFIQLPEEEVAENETMPWIRLTQAGAYRGPNLIYLVLSPLPIFIAFAFLRDVRHLGLVSVGADFAIFVGCVVTLGYITIGYKTSDSWDMYEWNSLPIFFGMVTSAFEGIGTIIPIESSMEGNRHNYSKFLHGAIFILASVLTLFGVVGYLRFGSDTAQMLNKNIPASSFTGLTLNCLLCVGVILTFPLQIFPVIEIIEIYTFGPGRCLGPKEVQYESINQSDDSSETAEAALLPKERVSENGAPVAASVPSQVATWKRNVLRTLVVLIAAGLAILLRDFFAYVGALVGAIGSSLLAYILPCFFHLRFRWHDCGFIIRAKDIIIIVFGILASLVSLYITVTEIVDKYR